MTGTSIPNVNLAEKAEVKVAIYTLADPRTGEVRYVGKTIKLLEKRLNSHVNDNSANHKVHWIKSLAKLGLKPVIDVLEEVKECDWQEAEKFWISMMKFYGFKLCNSTDGGEGLHNPSESTREKLAEIARNMSGEQRLKISNSVAKAMTPEYREHLSKKAKERFARGDNRAFSKNHAVGRKLSEEHKAKIGIGCKGHPGPNHSLAIRKAISEKLKGRKLSPESIAKREDTRRKNWLLKKAVVA